jgi:hypothetical protein
MTCASPWKAPRRWAGCALPKATIEHACLQDCRCHPCYLAALVQGLVCVLVEDRKNTHTSANSPYPMFWHKVLHQYARANACNRKFRLGSSVFTEVAALAGD